MTLREAAKIKDLIDERNILEKQLANIVHCTTLNVADDNGKIHCTWRNGTDAEIGYLEAGYKADIEKIDAILRSLPSLNFPE